MDLVLGTDWSQLENDLAQIITRQTLFKNIESPLAPSVTTDVHVIYVNNMLGHRWTSKSVLEPWGWSLLVTSVLCMCFPRIISFCNNCVDYLTDNLLETCHGLVHLHGVLFSRPTRHQRDSSVHPRNQFVTICNRRLLLLLPLPMGEFLLLKNIFFINRCFSMKQNRSFNCSTFGAKWCLRGCQQSVCVFPNLFSLLCKFNLIWYETESK